MFLRLFWMGVLVALAGGCSNGHLESVDTKHDAATTCAASGQSCAASGCCLENYDTCLAQGNDRLCLNAIAPPACQGTVSTDWGSLSLSFPASQPCSYTAAQVAAGISIAYEEILQVDSGIELHPAFADAGRCASPDDAGLIVGYTISGSGQSYCLCDIGFCQGEPLSSTPVNGVHDRSFTWDGRNWNGPSDTNNAEGAPFPPGSYTINLTSTGTWTDASDAGSDAGPRTYAVTASWPLTITQ